jgi:hypothetical protein
MSVAAATRQAFAVEAEAKSPEFREAAKTARPVVGGGLPSEQSGARSRFASRERQKQSSAPQRRYTGFDRIHARSRPRYGSVASTR